MTDTKPSYNPIYVERLSKTAAPVPIVGWRWIVPVCDLDGKARHANGEPRVELRPVAALACFENHILHADGEMTRTREDPMWVAACLDRESGLLEYPSYDCARLYGPEEIPTREDLDALVADIEQYNQARSEQREREHEREREREKIRAAKKG